MSMPTYNDNKTKLMIVTSTRIQHLHNLPNSVTIGNPQIPFKQSMKKLSFTIDGHLAMNEYAFITAKKWLLQLHRLAYIHTFLTHLYLNLLVMNRLL